MTITDQARALAGRFDVDPQVRHHFSAGVYCKQMSLPQGYAALSHAHAFDHLSVLAKGRARVETDDGTATYDAPAVLTIAAGVHHKITALTDIEWLCIHATDETDPAWVDDVLMGRA